MASLVLILAILISMLQSAQAGCKIIHKTNSSDLLLKGTLLTSAGALPKNYLLVRSGVITFVGSRRYMNWTAALHANIVQCYDSVISPGFINTHEHLEYSTHGPLPYTGERYSHRHDWRVGARHHTRLLTFVNGTENDAVTWGELRHIFSGTTSITGGNMVSGLARNLDFETGLEGGLSSSAAVWDTFPLDDEKGMLRNGDCDYGPFAITAEIANGYNRYLAHIGEGIDAEAENEFQCLSNNSFDRVPLPGGGGLSTDIIAPNIGLVHALGLSELDFDRVADSGAMVVWSPRSNVFLYGTTLNVTMLLEKKITVALGTDWLPSGSATMSREAVCARDVLKKMGMTLESKTVWEMMTIHAAKVAGFEKDLGSLEVGKMADIVVFSQSQGDRTDPYAQAVFSPTENIELVLRGGKVLVAEKQLKDLSGGECEEILFGKTKKVVCVVDEIGQSFGDLEKRLGGVYPAVISGVPENEPSCEPTR